MRWGFEGEEKAGCRLGARIPIILAQNFKES